MFHCVTGTIIGKGTCFVSEYSENEIQTIIQFHSHRHTPLTFKVPAIVYSEQALLLHLCGLLSEQTMWFD